MPSLVTDNFRIFASQQFIESLEEPYDSSFNPASEDAVNYPADATASQKYRSKIYLFIGRSYNWNDDADNAVVEKYDGTSVSDFDPPAPVDCLDEIDEIYDDMIAIKRINRNDVSEVIRKRVWQSGIVYDMYKHDYGSVVNGVTKISATGQSKLYDSSFYVVNSNFQVYKCIYNGQTPLTEAYPNGKPSTVEPTGTSTSIQEFSDGYRWKYMYTIGINDYIKFVSTDFIPVRIDSSVQTSAIDGSIDQVLILNRGSDLTAGIYYVPVIGNGGLGEDYTKAIIKIIVPGATDAYANKIGTASVYQAGSGYTFGSINLNECYSSPEDALSRTSPVPGLGNIAKLELIISPVGGHGSNSIYELGGYRVMINKNLEFLDGNGDIPVNMQFRRFGLIEDPQSNSNLDFISPTATVCKSIKFASDTTVTFKNGEIISQEISNSSIDAKARVIHWDSVNKILRYYQNEYISAKQDAPYTNKLVPFSGTNAIKGVESQVEAIPDVSYSGTLAGITFDQGYSDGEIKKYSGKILYIENRNPVFRSNDQIEDVKLVIEF